jgi:hypothetical protein
MLDEGVGYTIKLNRALGQPITKTISLCVISVYTQSKSSSQPGGRSKTDGINFYKEYFENLVGLSNFFSSSPCTRWIKYLPHQDFVDEVFEE